VVLSRRDRAIGGGGLSGRLSGFRFLHESSSSTPGSNQVGFVAFELLTKYSVQWKRVRRLSGPLTADRLSGKVVLVDF
jgi:hypothetical protein